MRSLNLILRALPVVLPLAFIPPLVATSADEAQAKDEAVKTYDYGAKVKIELRMEDGSEVQHRAELRALGHEWQFEFEGADHNHVVAIEANGEEGKKNFQVTLSYDRDGESIIPPFEDTYAAKKRQILWNESGTVAVALTLTPTKFPREDTSRDDQDKIQPDEGDDPLGGDPLR